MNIEQYNRRLLRDKGMHYFLVMFVVMLIVVSVVICGWALYGSVTHSNEPRIEISESSELPAKPLPDFIVDKVEPNELEQLKP